MHLILESWGNVAKPFSLGKSRIDLTQGPIYKNLLLFAVPILLGTVVTQLYHVADSVIVGQFVSADALAAVSASAPAMSVINMFMIGLSTGSTVVIAQRAGAKDQEGVQKAIGTIGCLTLLPAIFITVAGLLLSKPLLTLLGTPQEIFQDSYRYLVVVYLGTMGNMVYQMGSGAAARHGRFDLAVFVSAFVQRIERDFGPGNGAFIEMGRIWRGACHFPFPSLFPVSALSYI